MLLTAAVVPVCGWASSAVSSSTVILSWVFSRLVTCIGRPREESTGVLTSGSRS